jgi:hypothetical protein
MFSDSRYDHIKPRICRIDQQQSSFHLIMELRFYMETNSLKLSHKNKPLTYKSFMKLMDLSHSPMWIIYT